MDDHLARRLWSSALLFAQQLKRSKTCRVIFGDRQLTRLLNRGRLVLPQLKACPEQTYQGQAERSGVGIYREIVDRNPVAQI